MKKLILLVLLIPQLILSQDSWFNIQVQFDSYGPQESFIVVDQVGDTLVNHAPTNPSEFFETLVYANSGDLTISLFDSWGDGWADGQGNYAGVVISNNCQGEILNLDATFDFEQY